MNATQHDWIASAADAAARAFHVWPTMAACEAALESNYGQSILARQGLNLFGMKQHQNPSYETLNIPTKEYLDGSWTVVNAEWVKYDTLEDCFKDRMATLSRMAPKFPHYADALAAPDPKSYAVNVSESWSTDPERGAKCISIFGAYQTWTPPSNAGDVASAAVSEG